MRERERESRERAEADGAADSSLSREPNMGLHPRTITQTLNQRSHPGTTRNEFVEHRKKPWHGVERPDREPGAQGEPELAKGGGCVWCTRRREQPVQRPRQGPVRGE